MISSKRRCLIFDNADKTNMFGKPTCISAADRSLHTENPKSATAIVIQRVVHEYNTNLIYSYIKVKCTV